MLKHVIMGLGALTIALGATAVPIHKWTDAQGNVTSAGLPKSDVLYFELVDDAWVCIRPSGTEPKIKLYVNTNAGNPEDSAKENAELVEACKALMA